MLFGAVGQKVAEAQGLVDCLGAGKAVGNGEEAAVDARDLNAELAEAAIGTAGPEFELLPVDVGTDGLEAPELDEVAGDADRGQAPGCDFGLLRCPVGIAFEGLDLDGDGYLANISVGADLYGRTDVGLVAEEDAEFERGGHWAVPLRCGVSKEYPLQLFSTRGIVEASGCS